MCTTGLYLYQVMVNVCFLNWCVHYVFIKKNWEVELGMDKYVGRNWIRKENQAIHREQKYNVNLDAKITQVQREYHHLQITPQWKVA